MIKHHILVKWDSSVVDKKLLLPEIQSIFDKLYIYDEIRSISYYENIVERPNRYDLMICIEMEEEFLPIYDKSAPHQEWKEKYGKFVENKAIFDSEA